jgi:CRISPR/Cas system-associated protein Cas10 (large subunit of type III CRISPR-Cas system)
MNIQQFGIAYAERYEDRISKLQKVFTENSKNVLCATLKASYPKLFGRIKALSGATRDNCVSQEFLFNFLFPSERRTCLHCGSSTKFTAEFKRYREFCCSECRNASDIVVQRRNSAVFDKYGVDNIFKAEQFKEHTKKVMQKKYGVTNPSQSELVKERKRETFLSNYGVDHVSKTAKAKQRFSENNPMYDKVSVARMRRTNRIRYGVANPAQNKEVIAKTKKTHEDRYSWSCKIS